MTDTGWIEKAIALVDHRSVDNHAVKASAAAELAALRAENAKKDATIDTLNRALVSLTPLGSEFHMNPERCVNFVREMRDGEHKALIQAVKGRRAAEAENAAQARQIAALRAFVQFVADYVKHARRLRDGSPSSMPSLQKDPVTGRNDYVVPPPLSEGALDEIRANLGIAPSSMRLVPLERLREIEWLESHNGDEPLSCPVCLRYQSFDHMPDCWLAAAIAETEPLTRDTIG